MPHKQTEDQAKRAFTHGSGQAAADMASDPKGVIEEHRHIEGASSRPTAPDPEGRKHDHMAEREAKSEDRQEALLDEAIEETFPSSDPISPKHIT
ncbi:MULTISPECIES: hypothetical protein [unclassified Phenylobacterium]|uniref:hypothetical protein n=1 Tax=unclassified Phenylobacterium TaxID=2640670 RepID=UPI00083B8C52|nr:MULTISPECIES: hypothetical protein [unclassified Phenylobacterium]